MRKLTFSALSKNDVLYSPGVSGDSTHAWELLLAAVTSCEFDRDLPPPGSQLLRSRPRLSSRVGLWLSLDLWVGSVFCELPVLVRPPGGVTDVLLPRASGPGDGARTPSMGNDDFRFSRKELLRFLGSATSFLNTAGGVVSGCDTGEPSLVCGTGGVVGRCLSFRSLAGTGGGASEGGGGVANMSREAGE